MELHSIYIWWRHRNDQKDIFKFMNVHSFFFRSQVWWKQFKFSQPDVVETVTQKFLNLWVFSFCFLFLTFDGITLNTIKVMSWKRSNRNILLCDWLFLVFFVQRLMKSLWIPSRWCHANGQTEYSTCVSVLFICFFFLTF